ncbi:RNA polymerase-binding, DksA [Candidatus Magnetoovum chiemensis]|nr:RNA polymerase-binding, DksA [Candidatus Magnetoovum chiemensis]
MKEGLDMTANRLSANKEHTADKEREEAIQRIKNKLLEMKQRLLDEAGSALNAMPDTILYPDLGDQANAEIDRNFMLRLRGREQKLLVKIDTALEKIEDGIYGKCESCGSDIGSKRLEARPVTTLCIDCKTEQEEDEKMREEKTT